MKRRDLIKAVFTGAGLAMMPAMAKADDPSPEMVFDDPQAPVLGDRNGDVTVVEYFDYQCGYCKRDYPMVRDVIARDGNVKLVMKDWPIFGDVSVYAAQATLGAAALGEYPAALDSLMRATGRLTHQRVENLITDAGLDFDAIAASVRENNASIAALLDRNYRQAMAFQFVGTPSFVIGRTIYPGVLDKARLEEAIAKARAEG